MIRVALQHGIVAASLLAPPVARADCAPAEVSASPESPKRVLVVPLRVVGAVPELMQNELVARAQRALVGSDLEVAVLSADAQSGPCGDATCWRDLAAAHGAEYLVEIGIEAQEPDYVVRAEVIDGQSGEQLARADDRCDLCGRDEVAAMVADLTATVRRRIEAAMLPPPVLVVRSVPPGADVFLDDARVGKTPLEMPSSAGPHRLKVAAPGYRPHFANVALVEGAKEQLSVRLVVVPGGAADRDRSRRVLLGVGTAAVVVGAAGLGGGIALLVLHGRPIRSDCEGSNRDPDGRCRYLHDTRVAGAVLTGVGAASLIAGIVVLAVRARRGRSTKAAVVPTATGLALAGRF